MEEEENLRRELIITVLIILVVIMVGIMVAEADRIRRVFWGGEEDVVYLDQQVEGYLKSEVKHLVYSQARELTVYPLAASLDRRTGEISSEKAGQIVAITETVKKIMAADQNSQVEPVTYKLEPHITAREIKQIDNILDSYITIITGGEGRRKNIKVAAKLINNNLVVEGEVFSFNRVVGPRTKKRGFAEAPELVNGQLTSGVGGGICQVSSTLYNAVDPDKLEIVERHSHSQEVSYVPEGDDATVTWDYLDFKFRNNFSHPIIIKAQVYGRRLKIAVLGK